MVFGVKSNVVIIHLSPSSLRIFIALMSVLNVRILLFTNV